MRVAAIAALAFALTGCYGSTEPATDVTTGSATLHGRGTANDGPAASAFEYYPTNGTGFPRRTTERHWPAGASGPVTEKVEALLPATPYEFRLCGHDEDDAGETCANKQRFTTHTPPGDGLRAAFWTSAGRVLAVTVDATSGPAGENPAGSIHSLPDNYRGFVTCLRVEGQRAAVVSVGQRTSDNDPGPEYLWYTFAEPAIGMLDGGIGDGTGPDCRTLSLEGDDGLEVPALPEIAIWDSP